MLSQFRDEAYALDLIGENASGVGYLLKPWILRLMRGLVLAFCGALRRR
jgi:hypothetical protein